MTIKATLMMSAIGTLSAGMAMAEGAFDSQLAIDPASFTTLNVTVDGTPVTVKRYDAVYVGKPVAMAADQPARQMGPGGSPTAAKTQTLTDLMAYQKLSVYVTDKATENSAIILNVNNGGWFASELKADITDGSTYVSTSDTDKVGAALAAGYVFVDMGSRGRGIVAADATYPGKAPAAVVDAKAAIRFLRLNDAALPGSAERIVITGTSGGGGLSAVVAASGNSADYLPFLAEIGAAGVAADGSSSLNDDVFATIAYCPITDLGHADLAYEWFFQGIRSAENTTSNNWSAQAQEASKALAAEYPAYLAGLGLKLPDGTALTADNMKDVVRAEVVAEIERHAANGGEIPAKGGNFKLTVGMGPGTSKSVEIPNDWLTVTDGKVTDLDFDAYLRFVATSSALKNVPAFDRTANTGNTGKDGENSLFGMAALAYSNFTPWGWDHNDVAGDGVGKDDTGADFATWTAGEGAALAAQIKLINPLTYLGTDAKAASYWYVRHGMIDRDTSFPVEVALATAARNDADVKSVDFRLPWMTPHSGDYDVQEAYAWLADVLAKAK